MATNGKKMKVKRGIKHYPVEYVLKLSFEIQQRPDLGGMSVSGATTIPIRQGAGERLGRYKKEDVAAAIRQLADFIEQGSDPASIAAIGEMLSSAKASKNKSAN